jgi:hypothetical protein
VKYVIVINRWGCRWYFTGSTLNEMWKQKDGVLPTFSRAKRYGTKEFAERAAFKLSVQLLSETGATTCWIETVADAEKYERREARTFREDLKKGLR